MVSDFVRFRGHPMVKSTHPTTIEVTMEDYLTPKGDCIVGVSADKGCYGLSSNLKEALRVDGSEVRVKIVVGEMVHDLRARGDRRLLLSDPHDIVIRKSEFVSGRTLALKADAAAKDLPRKIVEALKDPRTEGQLMIEVRTR